MKIFASHRFSKNFRSASLRLQTLVEGAVYDFANLRKSKRETAIHNYDKLAHCKNRILEIDISRGHRLLAACDGDRLNLLDLGDHDVVRRYSDEKFEKDIDTLKELPGFLARYEDSGFFRSDPDETITNVFPDELSEEWLYFLDDEQEEILTDIYCTVNEDVDSGSLLVGGPGTGKTCILLNLLKELADSDLSVAITINRNVAEYLQSSTGFLLSDYQINPYQIPESIDVVISDDPDRGVLSHLAKLRQRGQIRHLVVGFDPLQLDKMFTDQEYNKFKYDFGLDEYIIQNCYRQKEKLGEYARDVAHRVAQSSPYLAKDKVASFREDHKKVTEIANEVDFTNPHGYLKVYRGAGLEDLQYEVNRLKRQKGLFWRHSHGIIVLLDGFSLTDEAMDLFSDFQRSNHVRFLDLNYAQNIKGLEFQHVLICMNAGTFEEIDKGFKGSGTKTYEKRRLLRIPFSRAKDSLVVFAFGED